MLFFFFLLPLISFSHVVHDAISASDKQVFSFATVCQKMVTHETPLIEALSGSEIDCMGKKILVSAFCEKELAQDPYYLRAYVNKEKREVVCQSGKKVLFKYLCVKLSDKELCAKDPKSACLVIQNKLAKRLDMVHFSFTENEKKLKQLNCYFESLPLASGNPRGNL